MQLGYTSILLARMVFLHILPQKICNILQLLPPITFFQLEEQCLMYHRLNLKNILLNWAAEWREKQIHLSDPGDAWLLLI